MTDTAKELLALREWMREPDYAAEFRLPDLIEWINRRPTALVERLSARQQASVEELARAICQTDKVNGAPSCVMDDHPEREPCNDENCRRFDQARALLAKYDIFEKVEG